ncbi:hypothetical protein XENTR_v10022802 [Xenopus tropicalis]|uniref:Protein JTB n=1 Tax=Xenopus tropicalis TaxID=8364 RepID=A0A803K4Q5_XENTR|nr:protein JTB [Xenopus tropicalis]KAE8588897.1 hypothetical protein XENTR_v10022802 [Xenopus tropicalis]
MLQHNSQAPEMSGRGRSASRKCVAAQVVLAEVERNPGSRPGRRAGMGPAERLLGTFLLLLSLTARRTESALEAKQEVPITQCWMAEEFIVSRECYSCTEFETKTITECSNTGFIEQVNCAVSKRADYKSCRSVEMEKQVFWKFVGGVMGVTVLFSLLVTYRQRTLDLRALEKVRKQIESI